MNHQPHSAHLIAPCGMNCRICYAFMREKNRCNGCNGPDGDKRNSCINCRIVTCEKRASLPSGYCYDCDKYCTRIRQLDKRYRTKYRMSMIENLALIRSKGMAAFLEKEKERWTCPACGETVCVHREHGPDCNPAK